MAQKYIVRCKDTTETSGTGTLTLRDTGAAGWQTLKDAVDRGLASNGDTARYYVSDDADPVIFEEGVGTIGSGGLTVTRDTVRQSSSGTSKISWPSGGVRNVVIAWSPGDTALISSQGSEYTAATFASNLGLPRLAAQNIFTTNAQIMATGVGVDLRDAAGLKRGRLDLEETGSTGPKLYRYDVAGSITNYIKLENANVVVGGTLVDVSSNKYDAFPSGFVMIAESIPTGWTAGYATDNRMIRLAQSGDTLGSESGTGDPFSSWATNSHTLTLTEVPAHTHRWDCNRLSTVDNTGSATFVTSPTAAGAGTAFNFTDSQGGGGGHSHTIATPKHRVMVRIIKS